MVAEIGGQHKTGELALSKELTSGEYTAMLGNKQRYIILNIC
jgi:hypothetical protein